MLPMLGAATDFLRLHVAGAPHYFAVAAMPLRCCFRHAASCMTLMRYARQRVADVDAACSAP